MPKYCIEACIGGRWPESWDNEEEALAEAVRNANSSKRDVHVVKCDGDKEEKIIRIHPHFIDNKGYYNPTYVIDYRTWESHFVRHEVETYAENVKPCFW